MYEKYELQKFADSVAKLQAELLGPTCEERGRYFPTYEPSPPRVYNRATTAYWVIITPVDDNTPTAYGPYSSKSDARVEAAGLLRSLADQHGVAAPLQKWRYHICKAQPGETADEVIRKHQPLSP